MIAFKVKYKNSLGLKELVYPRRQNYIDFQPGLRSPKRKQLGLCLSQHDSFCFPNKSQLAVSDMPKSNFSFSNYFFVSDFTIYQPSFISPEICAFITPNWD